MLALLWLLVVTMKSDAAQVITARSGGAVLLTSELPALKRIQDIRWTHPHLVMSLRHNVTTCHHRRCEMLSDGSLRFKHIQKDDAGNYKLEVFGEDGRRLMKKDFLLRVEDTSSSQVPPKVICGVISFLLLLSALLVFVILRRRRRNQRVTGPKEENAYVEMHGLHGNKRDKEEKQDPNSVVSMETATAEQTDEDGVYV